MPRVSIIMAAYGRPHLLKWAIQSVQRQSFVDWELLVVSDACPMGTRATVEHFAESDPRVHLVELARNWGEQSGPNNAGLARSSAPLVAFLNQDDLWFPDHLQVLLDWMDAAGADIALGASAHMGIVSNDTERLNWPSGLAGIGVRGRYCPVKTFSPMSAWLVRRSCFERIGLLPSARDCIAESSQTWLFRAWRNRLHIATCPELTSLIFSSGSRAGSYQSKDSAEQEHFGQQLQSNPYLRSQLLIHAHASYAPQPNPRKEFASYHFKRLLAFLGLSPRTWEFWRKHGRSKGDYIEQLRSVRGLGRKRLDESDYPRALLRQAMERHCQINIGERIDCNDAGEGGRFLMSGWHAPDGEGCLMQANIVSLCMLVRDSEVRASRLTTVWVLPPGTILYASANGEGIPLVDTQPCQTPLGATRWCWSIPEQTGSAKSMDFIIHTPTPGARLVQMWLE
ncbi:glycosyltransferase family 2 protein [Diaphorobacter ruginosibacter]|uniref:Glycosyltransferase family 2 protein n=1 Tax=Diaphorobacter ruginosibacter TaxID=1715720 RepID=A0A7G9RRU0_9BURK|nr:glycosyltransferase family 2 protein [Diaphorobacter ruginosibacter]QNN58315.1 glycosyltransferase family 2 protein [Diaphorobacter ruginosibacter]